MSFQKYHVRVLEDLPGMEPKSEVLERDVMLEQSMALMELKKAVIHYKTSPAPAHWARFGDCPNQLVAQYIGTLVSALLAIEGERCHIKAHRYPQKHTHGKQI